MKMESFSAELLERAVKSGFAQAEVYIKSGESFEAGTHEGEINSYEVSGSFGLGFRGLYNGKMGYASTQALDDDAMEQLIRGAKQNALLIDEEEAETLFEGATKYPDVNAFSEALEEVSAKAKLEKLLKLDELGRSLDEEVRSLEDCSLFSASGETRMMNTLGLDLCFRKNICGMSLTPIARRGNQSETSFRFACSRDFDALDPEALAKEGVQEALSRLGGEVLPSGAYPVVFRRDAAQALLGTFTGVFNAEAAQKGLSLLKGREGQTIASPMVTILDDPLQGIGARPFDGEGVPGSAKALVEDGVLCTLMHNRKTAAKQGTKTTGNASRSYGSKLGVSPTTFYLKPGSLGYEALLREVHQGILITGLQGLHSGADPVSGDFSLSAKGFRIEGGALGGPVTGITVAGNFFTLLQAVQCLGDDLYFGFPGGSCIGSTSLYGGKLTIAGK